MYLLDTNILVYYTNGTIPNDFKKELDRILCDSFRISIITKLEFLGWKGFDSKSYKKAQHFIEHADIIEISPDIADLVIKLRRSHSIKLADAIISATALARNNTLVTRNQGDFAKIPNLAIINPFS